MSPELTAPLSLQRALQPLTYALLAATAFSLGINLLMLVAPIYLMQVFDRVLTSTNLNTLLWLTVVAIGCVAVHAALEVVRGRLLSKIGSWLECKVTDRLIRAGVDRSRSGERSTAQPLRDLAQVRSFLSGPAIQALFDTPWALVFTVALWFLHPWYALFAIASVIVLIGIAALSEWLTHRLARRVGEANVAAFASVEHALHNSEAVHAMGMIDAILARWHRTQLNTSRDQDKLNDVSAFLTGISKFVRLAVQVGIVGLGAILAVDGHVTAGGMIAASILLGRALAPADQAIGCWKQISSIRSAWARVNMILRGAPDEAQPLRLPEPKGRLAMEGVMVRVKGHDEPLLNNINFELAAGESMAIVGPSAAGKSLLCKTMMGIVSPVLGKVRIDHADLNTWHTEDLRPYIGYLPQEISLFPGTVGENIARMTDADSRSIIEAAQLADVHELILRLPNGYQTDVGEFGHMLSGGQRQRIGLARAVFGSPKLVILDEPNSNLDPAGEAALVKAIAELKRRQCSLVVVSHKLGIVQNLDKTLLLQNGTVQAIGPSNEILSILMSDGRREIPMSARQLNSTAGLAR
jgi:PrtD family type I secretion system ABC transporter